MGDDFEYKMLWIGTSLDVVPVREGGPIMDARKGPEPGQLGMVMKTVSFTLDDLQEYQRLVSEGIVGLNFPNFVRQAVEHELARYRAEGKRRKKK